MWLQKVEDRHVKGRAKQARFPDVRVITIVGHHHGGRQFYELITLTDEGKLQTMSNEEFENLILRIEKENQELKNIYQAIQAARERVNIFRDQYRCETLDAIDSEQGLDLPASSTLQHAIKDYKFLSKPLAAPNSNIQFVGYEGYQRAWDNNFPLFLKTRDELTKKFDKRMGNLTFSKDKLEELILSASNGSVFYFMKHREQLSDISVVGAEDPLIGGIASKVDGIQRMEDALSAVMESDEELNEFKSQKSNFCFHNAIELRSLRRFYLEHFFSVRTRGYD